MPSLLIRNGEIVTAEGPVRSDIHIRDGVIEEIAAGNGARAADEIIDASGLLIFPGLIDCHVHFREPGSGEAEDMERGAAAALAGGITTVCDMPNTEPPTCTIAALRDKLRRARMAGNPKSTAFAKASVGRQVPSPNVDIRFFFGVAKREHLEELKAVDRNDICGVKLYLGQSTGNLKVESGVEEEVFRVCAERGIPLVCHCEDETIIRHNIGEIKDQKSEIRNPKLHSKIHSVEAAVKATTHAIALAKKYGTQLHIAHVSTADELALIRQAKTDGLAVTCEVAPHHLFLNVDDYDALGALAKVNPPIRTEDHCKALWKGIADGAVDCIASDHAPHTLQSKQVENALDAPSGVPGVETMVPLLLSCAFGEGPQDAQGVRRGAPRSGAPLHATDIVRLCFSNPNRIFRLGKPGITVGKPTFAQPSPRLWPAGKATAGEPADIILINPATTWTIRGKELHSKCGWTPYEEWTVTGKVARVIRR